MQEHMQTIQENMKTKRGMGGSMMMGGGQRGGMATGGHKTIAGGDMIAAPRDDGNTHKHDGIYDDEADDAT